MTAVLVESIPVGMEDLRSTEGVTYTEIALKKLVDEAKSSLFITAMYWQLTHAVDTSCTTYKECKDTGGFTEKQFQAFGADHGTELYKSLQNAIKRGVIVEIVQSPNEPGLVDESGDLKKLNPANVSITNIPMQAWYKDGIMHQKLWVADNNSFYVGSANMDWMSISQVKELGILVENSPELALDVVNYIKQWVEFGKITPDVKIITDKLSVTRQVPCWSPYISEVNPSGLKQNTGVVECKNPMNILPVVAGVENQLSVTLNGQPTEAFISGGPLEISGDDRTLDIEALVYTIDDADKFVYLSVVDFVPANPFGKVWWSELVDPLLQASVARGLDIRLMVSRWVSTPKSMMAYLKGIQDIALAAGSKFEIKIFEVPGWDDTKWPGRSYPGHSRVNHAKYIVTDKRINIGTSNMTWGFFYQTAGSSFNCNNPGLVSKLQEIFLRDWNSKYTQDLVSKSLLHRNNWPLFLTIIIFVLLIITIIKLMRK